MSSPIYQTKDGAPLTMMRTHEVPQVGAEKGFVTYRTVALLDGEEVGHLSVSWIPDFDERFADLEAFREAWGGRWEDEQSRALRRLFHADPYVAAVFVEFQHWRRHVALAMYRDTALWLADTWHKPLRAGDPNLVTDQLWHKLKALGEPVIFVDVGDGRPRPALDYTKGKA